MLLVIQILGGKQALLLASERSSRDTLRGNTFENGGYLCVYMCGRTYVILYFDPCVSLQSTFFHTSTKQNPFVQQSRIIQGNYLSLHFKFFSECHKTHLHLLFYSILCSNSLELLVKLQNVMANDYHGIETLYQT